MGSPVVHWEFWSQDVSGTSAFYSEVFDWQFQEFPGSDYTMVETGGEGGINGGIMKPKPGPVPAKVAFYIDVDDLATYRQRIVEAGGKIIVEEQEIPDFGSLSLFEDPEGRVLGLWQRQASSKS